MEDIFSSLGREVVLKGIADLKPFERNARRHSKKQLRKLADVIRANKSFNPIVTDENNMILAGHARWEAAKLLGLTRVPVVTFSGLTDHQKRAYIIADNRLHDESSFDKGALKLELEDLSLSGFDLELTGLDTIEIDKIFGHEDVEPPADDDVNLPSRNAKPPVSRLDDLWVIGDHRLGVGDARDLKLCERLLDGARAQLIFTDPPYGCAIAGNVSGLGKVKHEDFVMGAGETSLPEFGMTILRPAFKLMAAHAASGAIAFVCTDWRAAQHLLDAAQGVFDELKNLIVWTKTNAGMGTFYRSAHELIYAFKVSPGKHINNFGLGEGGRHRSNVWSYAGANVFRAGRLEDLAAHATVKPKKLVADAILDCSKVGDIVLDPFCGSGTTLVAAAMTRRKGYGIELDPKFADVILARVAEATGIEPTLDGVPFSVVAAEREESSHD